jgi:spermidine synthase
MPSETRRTLRYLSPAAFAVFALSGCAGLIYQSVWAQYLGLFLGHAAYAQSLVLAIFMGGMAIGAWWASVRAMRWTNLLRAYAWIELSIGIAAAIFHPIYVAATRIAYDDVFPALADGAASSVFKWFLAALLILPQAIALGATFPLMSTGLMRRLNTGNGAIVSGLYFTNSIGAAMGALVSTFVLLPAFGLPGAMEFGAVLNIIVAIVAFMLARQTETVSTPPVSVGPEASSNFQTFLLTAAFVTGATSFVYEIGWVRMLSLAFGSTVHAFELMLAAFIGGLAFGGLWIRKRIDGFSQPIRVAGTVQILMGLAALLSLVLYDVSFDGIAWFMGAVSRTDRGYVLFNLVTASFAIFIMAPAAFFAGMTLPLFTLTLLRTTGNEASVGRIYAANTLGAIVGVFAAIHFLLPLLGLKIAMIVAAGGDLALGIVLLRRAVDKSAKRGSQFAIPAFCAVALIATFFLARFDPLAMAAGVYRTGIARFDAQANRMAFYRDGKTASVATFVNGTVATIATNGKPDASIQLSDFLQPSADEITQVLLGMLPLATLPTARTAAVIGFGSGLSTHTLLADKRLESVDTIEIEPAMVDGAKIFGKHVERAYDDPRSHIHFDDARAFFASSASRYDIIVSEPSNPWVSGVGNLFSTQFYRFASTHLVQNGVFVQWLQLYEIDDELMASVVRAMAPSFSDFRIYLTDDVDMVIIATPNGALGPIDESIFFQPTLMPDLMRTQLNSPADLSIREVGDRKSLMPFFDALSTRSNSDFHPILSLESPRNRFAQNQARSMAQITAPDLPVREVLSRLPPPDASQVTSYANLSASTYARRASEIASALKEDTAPSSAPLARATAYIRSRVGHCLGTPNETVEIDTLIELAGLTIPYLDTAHLNGVWSQPNWTSCDSQSINVRILLGVLDALSRRDFSAAQPRAVALLNSNAESLSPLAKDWLVRTAMLSAIADHDDAKALAIDDWAGSQATSNPASATQREYLRAFAKSRVSN